MAPQRDGARIMSKLKPRDPAPLFGWSDKSRPPMSSWTHTNSFYGGSRVITEFYDWDDITPSFITDTPGFGAGTVAHMSVTFVEQHTGEIEDVHDHYFAGGKALEKVRNDFKFYVVPC